MLMRDTDEGKGVASGRKEEEVGVLPRAKEWVPSVFRGKICRA